MIPLKQEKQKSIEAKELIDPIEFFDQPSKKMINPIEFNSSTAENHFINGPKEPPPPERRLFSPIIFYSSPEEARQAELEEQAAQDYLKRTQESLSIPTSEIHMSQGTMRSLSVGAETKMGLPVQEDSRPSNAFLQADYIPLPYGRRRSKPLSYTPSEYNIFAIIRDGISCFICEESLYVFNTKFYQKRSEREVQRMIKTLLEQFVNSPIKTKSINEIVKLLYLEEKILKNAEELNQAEIAFENGVLNIRTGAFYSHSPASLVTYLVRCNYVPSTQPCCPRFQRFLQEITGGDTELQIRILEMIGYILSPDTGAKAIFLLQGISGSGKSVLVELIKSFFSEESVMPIDVNNLGARFIASSLVGKALAISADMTSAPLKTSAVSKLKQFSGGDYVSAEVKYNPLVSFYNRSKFVLVSNHPLLTVEQDDAFVERIVTIPFEHATPPELRDRTLIAQLRAERDGIASWAIAHYFNLVKRNYLFTGSYPLNASAGILQNGGEDCRIETNAFKFLARFFEPSITEGIFTEDAYSLFIREYGYTDIKVFSNHFVRIADNLFNAEKTRRRRTPDGNPISYIKGIKLKRGG